MLMSMIRATGNVVRTAASAIMTASVPICTAMGGVLAGVVGTAEVFRESHKSRRE
jgi:hypothetical protein